MDSPRIFMARPRVAAIPTGGVQNSAIRTFLGQPWPKANIDQRAAVSLISGKQQDGTPLEGHLHARFSVWFDQRSNLPSRLLIWRETPFSEDEIAAFFRAAQRTINLGFEKTSYTSLLAPKNGKDSEPKKDPWTVTIVPLDSAVSIPTGFNRKKKYLMWEAMTPYVPLRHFLTRRGKAKVGQEPENNWKRN